VSPASDLNWRAMSAHDLAAVSAIAARVHPDHPEDEAVFAERLRLYPVGCQVLVAAEGDVVGYVISHPWCQGEPPALNVLLGEIPVPATIYYIHDLALLPGGRGNGAAAKIVTDLSRHAQQAGLASVALIAVNHSNRFWQRQGFAIAAASGLNGKLASYGEHARMMARQLT